MNYRYSEHETFPCRYTWLPKAVRSLTANSQLFFDEDAAMVALGVGKNLVQKNEALPAKFIGSFVEPPRSIAGITCLRRTFISLGEDDRTTGGRHTHERKHYGSMG